MGGLILVSVLLGWSALCVVVLRALGGRIRSGAVRWGIYSVMLPVLLVLPLSDELIGAYQFEQYCKDAKDVRILGTIPVGEELYFPDGRWRRDERNVSLSESNRLADTIETLIRYDSSSYRDVPAVMPIAFSEVRIRERQTDRTLAEYKEYITHGGWISRKLEKPLVSRDACAPDMRGTSLQKALLHFNMSESEGNIK